MWGRGRKPRNLDDAWSAFEQGCSESYGLDAVLLAALDALALLVPAEGYYAYAGSADGQSLAMRTTRVPASVPAVGPHYAGLLSGAPLRAHPLEVAIPADPEGFTVEGPPSEAFLTLTCGRSVVLRAALHPRHRGIDGKTRALLLELGRRLRPALDLALHADELSSALQRAVTEGGAARKAMEVMLRLDRVVDLICRLGAQHFQATAGALALWGDGPRVDLAWRSGDAEGLLGAASPRVAMTQIPDGQPVAWVGPELPEAMARLGMRAYVLVPARLEAGQAALVLGLRSTSFAEGPWRKVAETLSSALGDALGNRAGAAQVSRAYVQSMVHICDLVDAVDPFNVGHSQRVALLCERTARALGLSAAEQATLRLAGRLHDLGMAAVDLDLPLRPGLLSAAERELIREHATIGADLVAGLPPEACPPEVERAIRHHHERWDGAGYPSGLGRQEIPLEARIVAAAECLVARVSARSYRPPLPVTAALHELQRLAGTQLDPEVVGAVLRLYGEAGIRPAAGDDMP